MAGNLAEPFADPNFDPKRYINEACASRTGEEPVERWGGGLQL